MTRVSLQLIVFRLIEIVTLVLTEGGNKEMKSSLSELELS